MTGRVLPDPRLPRSPRVRDRWARMRPAPPLTRQWVSLPYEGVDSLIPEVDRWHAACERAYGKGEAHVETWTSPDRLRVHARTTYRPNNPRRT